MRCCRICKFLSRINTLEVVRDASYRLVLYGICVWAFRERRCVVFGHMDPCLKWSRQREFRAIQPDASPNLFQGDDMPDSFPSQSRTGFRSTVLFGNSDCLLTPSGTCRLVRSFLVDVLRRFSETGAVQL